MLRSVFIFCFRKDRASFVNLWHKLLIDTKFKAKTATTLSDIYAKNICARLVDITEDVQRISRTVHTMFFSKVSCYLHSQFILSQSYLWENSWPTYSKKLKLIKHFKKFQINILFPRFISIRWPITLTYTTIKKRTNIKEIQTNKIEAHKNKSTANSHGK